MPTPSVFRFTLLGLISLSAVGGARQAAADLPQDALAAAKKATRFLTEKVSTHGGYLWRYSADLSRREGEGVVEMETIWVQPPGTPSIGEAFVRLYEATGDDQFLQAARDAAEALRQGQMRSGGWQAMVEFDPQRRAKWAYRVDPPNSKQKDQSSLDDDKTQSAIRFIVQLDRALEFQDAQVHQTAMDALSGLIEKGQYPNGGFPQVWQDERLPQANQPPRAASFPETWSRTYQGHNEYWRRCTLNDNLAGDVMETLFLAEDVYGDPKYRAAALKLADWLLLAQMPEPQPAWAQQYSFDMQPIWARKFEPPAITTSESFDVINTLMTVYERTGDKKYLAPLPKAIQYLKRCELPDGQVARFYELETNRPLYFDREYQLTYDDGDLPTHYGFKLSSKADKLETRYQKLAEQPAPAKATSKQSKKPRDRDVQRVIEALDDRGAWLSKDGLRYHKTPGPTIDMADVRKNLNLLADYLAHSSDR
ncbi:pectic acid lyase [Roseiconus nitratireducens]|uniref:Pectic acid lyase n=1 Tax=Roseiconus nitratireducens TaxID=2605748 RepID=A0A5M6DF15_9BACT|nr:pectate lyase [Roseiconus nitratireducens]KAA5545973.1 pectic acid lyase [Roseiconus nitratireducens]